MASSDLESDLESLDSDAELQAAFQAGLLKPGLNLEADARKPKEFVNNVPGLKSKLSMLTQDLDWSERLDLTSKPAPGAPNMELDEMGDDAEVHNDFKRELRFYRQAQSTVLEGLAKLKKLGKPTKRPEDYFAQMAKSDEHMKKVREKLLAKQTSIERSEKAKKLRELRKYGKKVQQEVLQKRHKEKRQMLDAVKKYRKGQQDKLDFLEEEKQMMKTSNKQNEPNKKRIKKNAKFGFGGQKKRSKYNTAESAAETKDFSVKKHATQPGKKRKQATKMRPGKGRRKVIKNKRKR